LNGSPWNGQVNTYSIAAGYNTALAIGDPVKSSGTSDANGVQGIVLGSTTGALRGVIVGLGTSESGIFNPLNLNSVIRPASDPAAWYALVADDPAIIFEIQEESNTVQLAAADVGLNTIPVSGTNNGYLSGWLLASTTGATPATTATLQLRLLGLSRKPNNAFGAYAKWLVKINVHELGTGTGAAGV
jgi:hypothetical protein